jgi:hypothetical protein
MRETQRAYVERVLRERGLIATFDVLYQATYEDGTKTSISRLAAIIHTLRGEGWHIESHDSPGHLATYALVDVSPWRCMSCGGAPNAEPEGLLGDMGRAWCVADGGWQTFRRRRQAVPA